MACNVTTDVMDALRERAEFENKSVRALTSSVLEAWSKQFHDGFERSNRTESQHVESTANNANEAWDVMMNAFLDAWRNPGERFRALIADGDTRLPEEPEQKAKVLAREFWLVVISQVGEEDLVAFRSTPVGGVRDIPTEFARTLMDAIARLRETEAWRDLVDEGLLEEQLGLPEEAPDLTGPRASPLTSQSTVTRTPSDEVCSTSLPFRQWQLYNNLG